MESLAIAWRNLRTRPLQTLIATLIVAAGTALAISAIVLAAGLRRGLTTAGGPFEIVVGPKGSATQLVMSSVLLQDVPLGNIPYAQYEALRRDARVRDAVPIGLGDNIAGLRLVGTTPAFFEVAVTPGQPPFYQVAQGRAFSADFEAVLGAQAAEQLGLSLGGTIVSSHGVLGGADEAEHADSPYRIVGVLARTNTPADLGIYVPLSSYWHAHGEARASSPATLEHADGEPEHATSDVTAVLVRASTISGAYQLYQELNAGREVQAALPGLVLTQFLDLLGQGQRILEGVTYVALAMAALSMGLSLYGAALANKRDTAILRALGASRATVLQIALWEAGLLGGMGLLAGILAGHAVAGIVGLLVTQQSALSTPMGLEWAELPVALLMLLLGLGAGLLPALRAYRLETAYVLSGAA